MIFRIPIIAALLATGTMGEVSAQAEITYPTPSAARSMNAVAPDGRHWVAALSGGDATRPTELTVLRQVSDQPSQPWAEVIRFSTDSLPSNEYRIKAGKSTIWIAWQAQPVAGGTRKIQIRQVYPGVGGIETVSGSEDQSAGFDLAVDAKDRPCVVSYKTNNAENPSLIPHIRLHRRGVSGGWEHVLAASYDEEIIAKPEEVSIATNGDDIHVYDVAWAQITFTGVTLRQSTLYHTAIKAPGTLVSSQSISYQVANETSNASQGLRPAIANVSATTAPDGMPAVSYSHLGSKQVKYGYKATGSGWSVETLLQPSGTITAQFLDETSVAVGPTGQPAVVWRSSDAGDVARSTRHSGGWTTKPVYAVKLDHPALTLDSVGNPHFTGTELSLPNRVVAVRPKDITDADGNGFTALLEDAFLMDPGGRTNAPEQHLVTVDGRHFPAFGYYHAPESTTPPANPFIEGGFRYTVEVSSDLAEWSTALLHHDTNTQDPWHSFSLWRSAVSLEENPRQFFRIRVNRLE
jgi:hypothetical protein